MNKKYILSLVSGIVGFLVIGVPAFAHVVVTPHTVGVGATQDFTVNVPNEKDSPITSVGLLIPNGVTSVVPNVTSGWTINTKSTGSGDNQTVTEIDWSDGSIPVGQRAELIFQAQVPAKQTTLNWKAYQTYSDGTVVSWDVDPNTMKHLSDSQQDAMADKQNKGVYSTTIVVNDLANNNSNNNHSSPGTNDQFSEWMSVLAVVLSIGAVYLSLSKRRA